MSVHNLTLADATIPRDKKPIQMLTDNGFSILRSCDLDGRTVEPGRYCFVVRDPNGYEAEITVRIGHVAAQEVAARSYGKINGNSGYWTALAERHLADYLWRESDYPPDDLLVVTQLTPIDCDLALRWTNGK